MDNRIYASGPALVLRCRVLELVGQVVEMHGLDPDGNVNLESSSYFTAVDRETGEIFMSTRLTLSPKSILPLRHPRADLKDTIAGAEVRHA